MEATAKPQRPVPGVMFGITHSLEGNEIVPVVREPKLLKIGIGLPKGKAIHAYIDAEGKWNVVVGYKDGEKKSFKLDARDTAEKCYREKYTSAPECPYPRKLPFFTFTHQVADGSFEADFDAIAAHGSMPSELDIVFLDDDPFNGAYQMWSKSQLECSGDGINARMIPARARSAEEKALGETAKSTGEKYFPVLGTCWTGGCPYSKPTMDGNRERPSLCKPSGDLKFQLARNLRVGGTAYFHTSGVRSIQQMFSSLYRFKMLTGGGDYSRGYLVGIPFKMVLRPYRTNHNGQAATQYGVSLEFRAETVEALQKNMLEQAVKFRSSMQLPARAPRMLEAPADMEGIDEDAEDESMRARGLNDEFYATSGETVEDHRERLKRQMEEQSAQGQKETKPEENKPDPEPVSSTVKETETVRAEAESQPEPEKTTEANPTQTAGTPPWMDKSDMLQAFSDKRVDMKDKEFFQILANHGIESEDDMVLNSVPVLAAFGQMNIAIEDARAAKAAEKPAEDPVKKPVFGSRGRKG